MRLPPIPPLPLIPEKPQYEQFWRDWAESYGRMVREECAKIADDMEDYGMGEIAAAIRSDE